MYAQISLGCDRAKTPSIVVRHNVAPIEFGRTVQIVALMSETDDPVKSKPVGVKQVNIYTDGAGNARTVILDGRPGSIGRRALLDVAFLKAMDELEKLDTARGGKTEDVTARGHIAEKFRECLVDKANEWPKDIAKLIAECSA